MKKPLALVAGLLFALAAPLLLAGERPATDVKAPVLDLEPLPSKFDLRTLDVITPIKQQMGGTCWTHGAMAAIESNLLISGVWKGAGNGGFPACSEYHLDWWNGFNKHMNEDIEDPAKDPSGLRPHVGGDYRVTAAYIARGDGVVLAPRTAEGAIDAKAWYGKAPTRNDANYKRFYVRDIEWFTIGDNLEGIDVIKRRLMREGAMGTAYAVGRGFLSKDFVHYQPASSKSKPNHAVAIIGWDDTKVGSDEDKKAPKPGAWLIKNSWGTKRGDEGYYWISYYDKCCCRDPEMGAVSFRNVEPMRYTHVYFHDFHGWRDTMPKVSKAFNAFTASGRQMLRAVSFYTAKDNVYYTAKLYSRFENGKLDGELASVSGTLRYTGFHTVNLDTPVWVKAKDRFYVYLELSGGGHAIDRTSEIPVLLGQKKEEQKKDEAKQPPKKEQPKIRPGNGPNGPMVISKAGPNESFYHDGTAWRDLYEYRFENPAWATFDRTANFCMKALAVAVPEKEAK
jgi:hypothetical protein